MLMNELLILTTARQTTGTSTDETRDRNFVSPPVRSTVPLSTCLSTVTGRRISPSLSYNLHTVHHSLGTLIKSAGVSQVSFSGLTSPSSISLGAPLSLGAHGLRLSAPTKLIDQHHLRPMSS